MSNVVYITDWKNIDAKDPTYSDSKVRYYIIQQNDYTYTVYKSYNFDSGAYWPVGDIPHGHKTYKEAKSYLDREMKQIDKGPGIHKVYRKKSINRKITKCRCKK